MRARLLSHVEEAGLVVTSNAYHARACYARKLNTYTVGDEFALVPHCGIQVSKKNYFLPTRKNSVLLGTSER